MENQSLDQLMKLHASSKRKMILGIVFTAVGMFVSLTGLFLSFFEYEFIIISAFALPFFCVGLPFLITGIVKTANANRQISLAKKQNANNYSAQSQPGFQAPQQTYAQQPQQVYYPPVQQAPVQQFDSTQPNTRQTTEPAAQAMQQPIYPDSTVYLDWQKYNPLDTGVSYNANKNYNFHRADGFAGSVPQKFVDRTFPKCPICCSGEPRWTISQHNQMSWKGNLYLFKCTNCQSIISMSMPDVTTLGNGAGGVAANPSIGLTNLMVKASSGKEAGAVYAVIESVGNSGVSRECEGKEFKLEHLQDMFLRK